MRILFDRVLRNDFKRFGNPSGIWDLRNIKCVGYLKLINKQSLIESGFNTFAL